ncbi:MAG TPA: Dabb family protein [Pyrinomonadaceae bacterium]|nr:Dabb family protein [Pyrinomonadaceae bacterium]
MLTHIVIWKYKSDAGEEERREHVAMLRRLPAVIPEVQSFAVGSDVLKLPRSYHTGLVATFKDRAGLEAYTVHPDHVAVADFGRNVSEHIASVDFEEEQ